MGHKSHLTCAITLRSHADMSQDGGMAKQQPNRRSEKKLKKKGYNQFTGKKQAFKKFCMLGNIELLTYGQLFSFYLLVWFQAVVMLTSSRKIVSISGSMLEKYFYG